MEVGFEKPAWYHCDHLGTPLEMTDDTGAIVWQASYSAFGITTIREGRQGLKSFGHSGKASGKPLNDQYQNNLRFQGQQYDEETGLHYNRHRYYDPSQGRYLSLDPIGLAGGDNLVGYVEGNPVSNIDPLGLYATAIKIGGGAWAAYGAYKACKSEIRTACKIKEIINRSNARKTLLEKLGRTPKLFTQSDQFSLEYLNKQKDIDAIHTYGIAMEVSKDAVTKGVSSGTKLASGVFVKTLSLFGLPYLCTGTDSNETTQTSDLSKTWHFALPTDCEDT